MPPYYTRQPVLDGMKAVSRSKGAAVDPVSALELFRIGTKRKRGESHRNDDRYREGSGTIDTTSPPQLLCLLQNPPLSLPLGLTEIAGPAGVGKTQMALSLCADCVQRNNNNKAVYIQLGGSSRFLQTAARRLQGMLESRMETRQDQTTTQRVVHDCLTRILVHWVCNSEELMHLLQTTLPRLLQLQPTISFVVLDGIASLFRLLPEQEQQLSRSTTTIGNNPWHHRATTFFQISNRCKELSSRFGVPFLVVNECTSRISPSDSVLPNEPLLEPALGLAWSQCVNCSFFVRRESGKNTTVRVIGTNKATKSIQVSRRTLQCLKAPHISSEVSRADFWIDRSGVVPLQPRRNSNKIIHRESR